jgi:DNA-binding NtrC family response regulator
MEKILIVENDLQVALQLKELVQRLGAEGVIAIGIESAVSEIRRDTFLMALVDLPGFDHGHNRFVERLRGIQSDLLIVAMVGEYSEALENEARSQGIIYFMTKPIEFEVLETILKHVDEKYGSDRNAKAMPNNRRIRE